MMQPHSRHHTSYREQFLSRYTQGRRQSTSPSPHDKKKPPPSLIPRYKTGPEKGRKGSETKVKFSSPDEIYILSDSQKLDDNSNTNKILNKEIEQGTRFDFREMIEQHAKTLNLSDTDRQCLGLGEYKKEKEEAWKLEENFDFDFKPSKESGDANIEAQQIPNIEHPNDKDDVDALSTWINLVDQLSLKNWFNAFTGSEYNNNKDDGYNDEPSPEYDYNDFASDNVTPENQPAPYVLMLSLIDDICEGYHSTSSFNNCFKCQYKDSFKSFTLNYLKRLDEVWRSKGFAPGEQEELFKATMEMWVYQLAEQNVSLAAAYDESTHASEKLKTVLLQSRNAMRTLQKESDKDKARIDALNYELETRDKAVKKMKYELEMQSEQMKVMEDTLQDTQADVKSLTELIIRLRDKGVWDINGLPMGDETFNKIFNGYYYLHGAKVIGHKEYSAKKREWRHEIEQLKSEGDTLRAIIAAKDKEIQKFKSTE